MTKFTYDEDGLNAKPPGGFGADSMPSSVPIDRGESSGISQAAVDRGYISGRDVDPNYPREPEFTRRPIVDRHITRRDWYGQGNPDMEQMFGGMMDSDYYTSKE